jgi:fused signal recognition particle receptor
MFKFLKEKLKKTISIFSRKVDEQGEEEVIEEEKKLGEKPKEAPAEEPEVAEVLAEAERIEKEIEKEEEIAPEKPVEEIKKEEKPVEKIEEAQKPVEEVKEEEKPAPPPVEEEKPVEKIEEAQKPVEEVKEEEKPAPEEPKKEGFFKRLFKKKEKVEVPEEIPEIGEKPEVPEISEEVEEKPGEKPPEKEKIEPEKPVEEVKEEEKPAEKLEEVKPEKEKIEPEKPVEEIKEEEKPVEKLEEAQKPIGEVKEEEKPAPPPVEEKKPAEEKKPVEEKAEGPKKKGFFGMLKEKIVTKKISAEKFDEIFWDLELALLENNVALKVIEKIKEDLRNDIVDTPIKRNRIEQTIMLSLKTSIDGLLSSPDFSLLKEISKKKPYVICFVGINGSGKTTTIAKIARMLLDKNKKVVLAAADTFRAAAIDQLQIHADKLGVKMIKHDYGSDPAAVAFDAVKYAESKDIDAVLIDTAGRLHSNVNLIDEMKKIIRVANPDMKLFVGEAITGNDCVEQASKFNEAVELDGIILSKQDIDEKGGASISISYVTKKPILYIGTGQEYSDIKPFNKDEIIKSLGLEA